MYFLFLILLIVVIFLFYSNQSQEGRYELVENKTKIKPQINYLAAKNFENFVEKVKLDSRLVCVVGEDWSGRTFLTDLLIKKYGYNKIKNVKNQENLTDVKYKEKFAKLKPPFIRSQFRIDGIKAGIKLKDNPNEYTKEVSRIEKERQKKWIMEGKFTPEQLKLIFKGEGYNRNFVLLFVMPKEGRGKKWQKLTGQTDYNECIKKSEEYLKNMGKHYRVYVIKNDFGKKKQN